MNPIAQAATLTDRLIAIAQGDEEILSIVDHLDQTYTIALANSVACLLTANPASTVAMLSADIGKPVAGHELETMKVALAYNLLWEDNDGARIGMAGEDGELVLLQDVTTEAAFSTQDQDPLHGAITRFADLALWWSQFVASSSLADRQTLAGLQSLQLRA